MLRSCCSLGLGRRVSMLHREELVPLALVESGNLDGVLGHLNPGEDEEAVGCVHEGEQGRAEDEVVRKARLPIVVCVEASLRLGIALGKFVGGLLGKTELREHALGCKLCQAVLGVVFCVDSHLSVTFILIKTVIKQLHNSPVARNQQVRRAPR